MVAELNENIETEAAAENKSIALPDQVLPNVIELLPISSRPFFPAQMQPVTVTSERWAETIHRVSEADQPYVGLIYCPVEEGDFSVDDLALTGCVARVQSVESDGEYLHLIAMGRRRFRIVRWLRESPPYQVEVEYPDAPVEDDSGLRARSIAILAVIKELLPLNPLYSDELRQYLNRFGPNDPSPLADFAASITTASNDELQNIVDTVPLIERMDAVLLLLRQELEVAKLQGELSEQVNDKISAQQREFFLREQLKLIQKELGITKDDKTSDVDEFRGRLEGKELPDHVSARIDDEMIKLSVLEMGSPEYGVTRNYLDCVTELPWGMHSIDRLELGPAREVLEKHHNGLSDVKDRIIEFIAQGAYKGEISGSIMLLVGPPGVGKTSIGKSIADALGRKFYRFSVGGMRDEAEIKGHRRTYIGAMPGKFVQALKEVEVENPVIMLDEVDKIGASFQGDPASALLEALDPEQNADFLDHYLDLRIDLSKVLFVCTANQLDTIPAPLLDRMEILRLAGYIAEEKLAIAKQHLWPKLLNRAGVKRSTVKISDAALRYLIEGYAREAGVRNLEKLLGKLIRKSIVRLLETEATAVRIGKKEVERWLGQPTFDRELPQRGVGVVTGLAWTSMGGATLTIEANKVHELGRKLQLTGQLGDVMKESAQIAYSYVMANLPSFDGDKAFFDKAAIHLHVPEGATPKDGPSAGVTMATSLISLAQGKPLRRSIAMTGELTLSGRVLAVGGIKEKVIAAKRGGINELILPEANRRDFAELADYLQEGVSVHYARTYRDVYNVVFA
ncbi:ATP dependent PIM1 peptidase [Sinobacterium caligoides]|uniref:Lon protease n=1 Tax=Sinobacterium caligoides TaxID=933926 RepID=A0A3N2E208_9GAMM|nr:endopeptidase La [Sinobacterium caligoides]ROS06141.1 ATP dependent PIM1 peptidase [Sinobacterium caligoides]